MSELPPLPSEDINDGEIRVFTYRHLREYAAIARQQGRDEMREWNASRVRALSGPEVSEEFDALSQRLNWNTLSAVNAAWHAFKCAIKLCERKHGIGTPKSAEGEGA